MASDDSKQGDSSSQAAAPKKIAMIMANKAQGKMGDIGFYFAELTHPFYEFKLAGFDVEFYSPDGGEAFADPYSHPLHESGFASKDIITLGFVNHKQYNQLLKNTKKLDTLLNNIDNFDGVFVCGGESPMITFYNNETLFKVVAAFYEAKKMTGIVCHGTCVLLKTKLTNGDLLVKGKEWTGFSKAEQDFADQASKDYLPKDDPHMWSFTIEEEANKIKDTNYRCGNLFESFAIRDGNLVTGQQQESARLAAKLITLALLNEDTIDLNKKETKRGYQVYA